VLSDGGEPLTGATVYIPAVGSGAYTNADGIFSIEDLPVGQDYEFLVLYYGYDTLFQTVSLPPRSKVVTVSLVLSSREVYTETVEISANKTGEINRKEVSVGVTEISPSEIRLMPSVGAPDLVQYLQVLPGVVFTGDQGGQIYIRGGTPIQNMVVQDNMVIYSPFHSIGLFSVFDIDYIRSIDVYSAGFPAQYGGRISSVIDMKTRNGDLKAPGIKVSASPFLGSILLEGPIVRSKTNPAAGTSYLLSARNNYIDKTSTFLYPYINDSIGLPYNFLDLYGKLSISDGVNYANISGFRHEDNVNYEFPANIGWDSYGGGADFLLLPSGASAIISGNFAFSRYQTALKSQSEAFPRRSSVSGFNGGLDVKYIMNSIDEFGFGMKLLGFNTDYTFTNSFGFITSQQSFNTELAGYARYKKVFRVKRDWAKSLDNLFERFVLEPSIRLHYFNNQSFASFEPRLRAKLNFRKVSFSLASGMYAQNLMSAVSDRDVVNLFQGFLSAPAGLANRVKGHNLQTARHLLTGVEAEVFPTVTTTVEAWVKDFTQLSNINREKIFPEEPDFVTETGLAYGFDFFLKHSSRSTYLYANYGWAKVTRNDFTRTYSPVFDRRHTINLVAAYKIGRFDKYEKDEQVLYPKFSDSKWEFGMRWTMGSGFPFTQTQGFFEKLDFLDDGAQSDIHTQNGQLGLILSDELNGGRLPYYHRFDISAKRRWVISNKYLIEANATVINVYDRQNIFYFDRIRFTPVYQLPVMPTLSLTLTY
jgi:hypothetical protein